MKPFTNSARWPQSARWRRRTPDAESVDHMICSNVISDHVTPAPGCFIAGALGYTGQTLDINGACTGFLKALDAADSAIRAGKARRRAHHRGEQPSALCDWTDRSSCILFGDGAGAVLLRIPARASACPPCCARSSTRSS